MSVATHPDRDTPIRAAWAIGEYSYTQIAARLGVRFTTVGRSVGRVIQMFECDDAGHGCMLRSVEILYRTTFRNPMDETQVLVTARLCSMALNLLDRPGSLKSQRSGFEPAINNTSENSGAKHHVNQKSPPASGYAFCSLHVGASNARRLLSVGQQRQFAGADG